MASTIVIPLRDLIAIYGPSAADALIAGLTAASSDIAALQAANSGTDWKESVRVATTTALAANALVSGVITASSNGALGTIDGVTLIVGNRILIKDEGGASPATSAKNGIYTVTSLGGASAKFVFTVASDFDTSAEVTSGLCVEVEEGTANAGKVFELVTANPITLGSTALGFDLFAGMRPATALSAGTVSLVAQIGALRTVRNVVLTNTSLASFTVTSATLNDNVSGGNIAGDRVLLVGQTDPTENGIYVVGTVGGSTAALTKATDWAATSVQPAGLEVAVNEGTIFGGTKWFASLAGAITVGTSSPAFYPRRYVRVTGVMAGTPGIKALTAEWILSTTKSAVTPVAIAPGTQGFLSRGALTAGFGNGAVTITSTANETSTLQVVIEN